MLVLVLNAPFESEALARILGLDDRKVAGDAIGHGDWLHLRPACPKVIAFAILVCL